MGRPPNDGEREREVDGFSLLLDAQWPTLRPGEKFTVRFTFSEPLVETPGSRLHAAVATLIPERDLDPWEEMGFEGRAKWEERAAGLGLK